MSKVRDVALAWLLHQPDVTAPILGPRTMEQLDEALRAGAEARRGGAPRDRPDLARTRRRAPEAYAW